MGAGYSQPPRGYQYSAVDPENKNIRSDPENYETESYRDFEELFMENWQFEKNLPFFVEIDQNNNLKYTTYEKVYSMIKELKPVLSNFNQSNPLGIYAETTKESFVIYLSCLVNGTPVIASGPGLQTPEEFLESAEKVGCGAIYTEKKFIDQLKKPKLPAFTDIYRPIYSETKSGGDYGYIFAKNTDVKLTPQQLCSAIPLWNKKLSICREARILLSLPLGSNLLRVVAESIVSKRAVIGFGFTKENYPLFLGTHFFASHDYYMKEVDDFYAKINSNGFLFKCKYYPFSWWKGFMLALGGSSSAADRKVFNKLQTNFGPEMRFFFVDKQLDYSYHAMFTTVMATPLSTVTIPDQWGNFGLCLPTDIRFTKYGTLGGPVACKIEIDPENKTISCDKSDYKIEVSAKWDEEGSLIVY